MADISSGTAYVDTALGTDDTSHGESSGSGACKTLKYMLETRVIQLTGDLTVLCVGGSEDLSASIALSGKSTAAYKLTIRGDRWSSATDGLFSTSKYNLKNDSVNNHLITFTELNLEIDGLQFDLTNAGTANHAFRSAIGAAAQVITVKNCIFRCGSQASSKGIYGAFYAGSTLKLFNTVFTGFTGTGAAGLDTNVTGNVWSVSNCTFSGCTEAMLGTSYGSLVKNCLFNNCGSIATIALAVGSEHNSSTEDETWNPADSHSYDPCSDFNFADEGNGDFRLTATSGDPNARNSGVTLTDCSPDPMGTARPSETNYSRGAFEYVTTGGGSSAVPGIMAAYRRRRG